MTTVASAPVSDTSPLTSSSPTTQPSEDEVLLKEKYAAEGTALCEKDDELSALMGCIVGARRVHWIARFLAQERVRALGGSDGAFTSLLTSAIGIGDTSEGKREMLEDAKFRIEGQIRVMIMNEIARQAELDMQVEELERAADSAIRAAQAIPLGFEHNDASQMFRDRTLALFGSEKTVQTMLDDTLEAIQEHNKQAAQAAAVGEPSEYCVTIRLSSKLGSQALVPKSELGKRTEVVVGAGVSIGSGNSHSAFEKFMSSWLRQSYKNRIDALVIDDASVLLTGGIIGQSDVSKANAVHRIIRKWADEQGCAVIMGIPRKTSDDEDPTSDLDRLAPFVDLKIVA